MRGDERIRTAVCVPSDLSVYERLERLDVDVLDDGTPDAFVVDADIVGNCPKRHPGVVRVTDAFQQCDLCRLNVRQKLAKVLSLIAHGVCKHRSNPEFHDSSFNRCVTQYDRWEATCQVV